MSRVNVLRAEITTTVSYGPQINILRSELTTAATTVNIIRAELATAASVSAGLPQTVEPGQVVTLVGSGGNPTPTTQGWAQISGVRTPTLSVDAPNQVSFIAPADLVQQDYTFEYNVDGATSQVRVTVMAATERAVVGGVEVPIVIYAVSG